MSVFAYEVIRKGSTPETYVYYPRIRNVDTGQTYEAWVGYEDTYEQAYEELMATKGSTQGSEHTLPWREKVVYSDVSPVPPDNV